MVDWIFTNFTPKQKFCMPRAFTDAEKEINVKLFKHSAFFLNVKMTKVLKVHF